MDNNKSTQKNRCICIGARLRHFIQTIISQYFLWFVINIQVSISTVTTGKYELHDENETFNVLTDICDILALMPKYLNLS